jgi:hypothetical protein
VLRPWLHGKFQVVGDSYIHGLADCEGLLGPLPHLWRVQLHRDSRNFYIPHYVNSSTGACTVEDPRLEALAPEWERLDTPRTPSDPEVFMRFKNKVAGEVVNSDPRLFPDALKKRGANLSIFNLSKEGPKRSRSRLEQNASQLSLNYIQYFQGNGK